MVDPLQITPTIPKGLAVLERERLAPWNDETTDLDVPSRPRPRLTPNAPKDPMLQDLGQPVGEECLHVEPCHHLKRFVATLGQLRLSRSGSPFSCSQRLAQGMSQLTNYFPQAAMTVKEAAGWRVKPAFTFSVDLFMLHCQLSQKCHDLLEQKV